MRVMNYTTKIDALKTIGEINKILVEHGAKSINVDYDEEGNPIALTFFIMVNLTPVNFRTSPNWKGMLRKMGEDKRVTRSMLTQEQALRVCWRTIKEWLEAQLNMVESEQAELGKLFLGDSVTTTGQTLYDLLKDNINNVGLLMENN